MKMHTILFAAAAVLVGAPLLSACHDDACHEHDEGDEEEMVGPLTGATCPNGGTTLTWENFAKDWFVEYCTDCHSSALTNLDDRMCAPLFHDFDTLAGVQAVADHIDQMAGSGPDATNTAMPPSDHSPFPTVETRAQISEWIACGAPGTGP